MRIEDRELRREEEPRKCLAFDAVTDGQVFSLAHYARDAPDTPVEQVLTEERRR